MAVQITDENLGQYLSELGKNVEGAEPVEEVSEVGDDTLLPGVKEENGTPTDYIRFRLRILKNYLDDVKTTIQNQWDAWFSDSLTTGVRYIWNAWFTGRQNEWDVLKSDAQSATSAANTAAQDATTAIQGAERVNAQLTGFTVTITDRNGQSRSVDIGFDIYRTYPSVAAMNADAANVQEGKFVMIATTDPTSAENARMYIRNSQPATAQQPFNFLCDLDQASAAAWADWLENMKPQIEAAITQALSDHTRAEGDHTTATQDHSRADTDHQAAETATNAANTQANRAKAYNDHPWEIGSDGYIYVWNEATQQMVSTNKLIVEWNDLTPAQRQAIIDGVAEDIVFASDQTCEDIIDEL